MTGSSPDAPLAVPTVATLALSAGPSVPSSAASSGTAGTSSPPDAPPTSTAPTSTAPPAATPASLWQVGSRPLPLRPDGFGQVLPTPEVLRDRSLPTQDRLPPPPSEAFTATVRPVPADVLRRSTWQPACPVRADQLRYLTVAFWGFDGRHHTGELIVNARVAADVVTVFASLHAARFPLEEMRVVDTAELSAAPTGDSNNTDAFVCRPARGQTSWSAHAYGLAIDLNPFCNPYTRGDLVVPELASAYVDRSWVRPGMIRPGGTAVRAFTAIGWTWGGAWASPRDLMHFTATGK
jgi:D-alanyl-D-alanine carboxypeptidase